MSGVAVRRDGGRVDVVGADGSPIADCVRFLERLLGRGLSSHTIESYAYDLALVYRWFHNNGLELGGLTIHNVNRFIAWERGRASSPKSINRRLHTLRLYYRFVMGAELPGGHEARHAGHRLARRDSELGLQRMPAATSRQLRVKEPKKVVEPLTVAQVRALVLGMSRYRDLCIAHLMLLCGLRSQETLNLRVGDVDFHDRRVRVRGKGNKERMVPLPKLLEDLLQRYLTLERPLTCATDRALVILQGAKRGEPMSRAALRRVFRTRRLRPELSNANPHRLRHTFGTDMARSGVRLPILQRMMGHANPETTLIYVNVSMADIAAEFHRAIESLEARYKVTRE
jgi:integrase/recombinase XerC